MQQANNALDSIPILGSGIGYRQEIKQAIVESLAAIDFVEIVTDRYVGDPRQLEELHELSERITVIPHGVGLSIGSATMDDEYLRGIKLVSDVCGSPYYSEHLAITRAPGIDIGHLSPLWFTDEVLDRTVDNVRHVQSVLGKPLILENVTYLFEIPGATMKQTDFFRRIVESTGCGILLDLTNLYTNAVNHRFDPLAFLNELPLENVVQLHLAGGYWANGVLIDGHCEPVEQGTWNLLDKLASCMRVKACILEHDANFQADFSILLNQVIRARDVITRCETRGATVMDLP